jgi:hypothetical protein
VALSLGACSSGSGTAGGSGGSVVGGPPGSGLGTVFVTDSAPSGTASVGTDPAGSVVPGTAPCTEAALLDGVNAQDSSVTSLTQYSCDGQWAYAATTTTTLLLEANGPRWSPVDTITNCTTASIPTDIKSVAC